MSAVTFPLEGRRIWVTGGRGFLGRPVVRALEARGAEVLASLSLSVGGLMHGGTAEEVVAGLDAVEAAAARLGTPLDHPFMAMSFLCLSVIPELKLADTGYVDLSRGGAQSLFVEGA